ncbi:acylamide-delta3(E)-desaturase [Fusarium albosuccineum]|uniref:Acylamide-delta3(E)-desaturase n=1 Tax=Fusarium albosuccineum TaxID=1237068 RepID=A0A8H4PCY7_9HYPO|nr:acylamide-delta3(E)-desaturase [Fusarium albosuccineum]
MADMEKYIVFHSDLTKADTLLLQSLADDLEESAPRKNGPSSSGLGLDKQDLDAGAKLRGRGAGPDVNASRERDEATLRQMEALNNPKDARFEPTVVMSVDLDNIKLPYVLDKFLLRPYVRFARSMVRVETDVVMLTHLILYFCTSIPSAILLFRNFSWIHGVLHFVMQFYYMGTYTLMMHQHIHMRGILNKRLALFDHLFPYITDPLMGHTWNSYFYHHVKHHHVEGNGPDDLSSTIRYQRDSVLHFLHYTGRFFFLIWADLPLYFIRKGRAVLGLKALFWEMANYTMLYSFFRYNPRATVFVLLIPFLLLRFGLMAGNWGQHALVDADEPDSDYRSSITLIDVASNRHCFNDGYHTSHHLNPLRHWREHPVSFMKTKHVYASNHALVFHDIDYLMVTIRLLMKDYKRLAECMVPIGDQLSMTMDERMELLKRCTRPFSEEEIKKKFKTG